MTEGEKENSFQGFFHFPRIPCLSLSLYWWVLNFPSITNPSILARSTTTTTMIFFFTDVMRTCVLKYYNRSNNNSSNAFTRYIVVVSVTWTISRIFFLSQQQQQLHTIKTHSSSIRSWSSSSSIVWRIKACKWVREYEQQQKQREKWYGRENFPQIAECYSNLVMEGAKYFSLFNAFSLSDAASYKRRARIGPALNVFIS